MTLGRLRPLSLTLLLVAVACGTRPADQAKPPAPTARASVASIYSQSKPASREAAPVHVLVIPKGEWCSAADFHAGAAAEMELVMEVCDLIWVLDAGKVIASGTPDEVRVDEGVIKAYLGEEAEARGDGAGGVACVLLKTGKAGARRFLAGDLILVASGDLSKKFGLAGKDDFSWMAYESDRARKGVSTLIQGVTGTSQELGHAADEMSSIALRTKEAIASQGDHTAQIAGSIMQLAGQVKEVSAQATRVASSANQRTKPAA